MDLMGKVREQATQVAQMAQDALKTGQEKVEQLQERRKTDALLRDLGTACYAERTGRGRPETVAEIERLIAALRDREAQYGPFPGMSTGEEPGAQQAGGAAPG